MRKANIQNGEKVLVNGAGGSIGTFGVQIAKAMGAEVTAVDRTIKEEMLRRIGADHFFDYSKEDFTKSGQTYDVIFDMVAKSSYSKCVKALNPKGCYLMANPRISDMLRSVLTSRFTDKTAIFVFAGEKEEELLALREMIEEGEIKPVIDKVYSFEQAAEAHRRVETEQRLGTVVISSEHNNKTERIRIDCESEANHNLILLLNKPGVLYIRKYLFLKSGWVVLFSQKHFILDE